jgi:hypothetical protein
MALLKHLSTQTSIGAVEAFFSAYRNHDIDGMLRNCNLNGQTNLVPLGDRGQGTIKEVGGKLWSELINAFPDLSNEVTSIFADLDGHVSAEAIVGGTQQKDFDVVKNQGLHFQIEQSFIFQVGADGLIQKIDCYWDNATIYGQLGRTNL